MDSKAKYASDDVMLQDAKWFEYHAKSLEEKAQKFRRLAAACRSAATSKT